MISNQFHREEIPRAVKGPPVWAGTGKGTEQHPEEQTGLREREDWGGGEISEAQADGQSKGEDRASIIL